MKRPAVIEGSLGHRSLPGPVLEDVLALVHLRTARVCAIAIRARLNMGSRYQCGRDDLLRTRFAIAPLGVLTSRDG